MYSQNRSEHFTIVNGTYYWLFIALSAAFLLYFLFDCSNGDDTATTEDCCCTDPSESELAQLTP